MEKIWLKQYQEGVPETIPPLSFLSIPALFDDACKRFKNRTAFVNMKEKLSYQTLHEKSERFAAWLQVQGLQKGARVAIMMPNLMQYPVALFGILKAGLTVVNTNPLYTVDETVHQLNDAKVEAVIVLANFAKTIEKALPQIPSLRKVIVTEIGDLFPFSKRVIVNWVVKFIKKMVPSFHIPGAITFRKTLNETTPFVEVPITEQDIAFLQYTGGTTGISKAAMLTHGNILSNISQATCFIAPLGVGEEDIIITALPLYHVFSLTANCLIFLGLGAKNILITNPRQMKEFIHTIKNVGFTAITGVNTLFNALLNHPDFSKINFSHLKLALSGGMSLQQSVAHRWHDRTGKRLLEAYGLTETSPAVTINPMYLDTYNGSIGLPLPSTDISIRDDEGRELPQGESGELCVKGPQVMAGYWQRPDETALVMTDDGFVKTGDIARMDDKGFIYLIDRKKDLILVSGFNVYPNEVEQVINLLPEVLEVGVIGAKKNESEEVVKAFVVRKDPSLTENAILEHCRKHLTAYKIPKQVEFVEELPKTNVGKVLRRALKDTVVTSP